jgi:hypothetical protein
MLQKVTHNYTDGAGKALEAEPAAIFRSTVWRSPLQDRPCTLGVGWPTTVSGQILLAAHKPVEKVVQSLFQGGRHRLVLPLGMLAKAHLKRQDGSLSPEARASCERRALSVPA